jgi:O-antigen/teichoic acid export membrane protein
MNGGRQAGRRLAALIDQGLVSATNFGMFLYCARVLSVELWGAFGFAYATVLFLQGFQRAAVIIPMITFNPKLADWQANAAAWARLNACLIVLATVACAIAAAIGFAVGIAWLAFSMVGAMVLLIPMFLLEFARRAVIQQENFEQLVALAAAYSAGCIGTLIVWTVLGPSRWMPVGAVAAGATCATTLFTFWHSPLLLGSNTGNSNIHEARQFSVWASMGHLGFSGYNFGAQAILGALGGPVALGYFHACRALLQPVNTLIGAMDSIDKPRAARAYVQSGRPGLIKTLGTALGLLTLLSGAYITGVLLFNAELLSLAYGRRYEGQEQVVAWWCAVAALTVLAQPLESGLYVIRRTKEMFYSRLLASAASLLSAWLLIGPFGAIGALAAIAVGYAISAACGALLLRQYA